MNDEPGNYYIQVDENSLGEPVEPKGTYAKFSKPDPMDALIYHMACQQADGVYDFPEKGGKYWLKKAIRNFPYLVFWMVLGFLFGEWVN